jgi:hypothetical protein
MKANPQALIIAGIKKMMFVSTLPGNSQALGTAILLPSFLWSRNFLGLWRSLEFPAVEETNTDLLEDGCKHSIGTKNDYCCAVHGCPTCNLVFLFVGVIEATRVIDPSPSYYVRQLFFDEPHGDNDDNDDKQKRRGEVEYEARGEELCPF